MKIHKLNYKLWAILLCTVVLACQSDSPNGTKPPAAENPQTAISRQPGNVVNVYTHRHNEADKQLYQQFEKHTGIKVYILKGNADELIKRLEEEGENTPADILITADAARLFRAKILGLLKPLISMTLKENVPDQFRDYDNHWCALSKRARIVAYAKDRVKPEELSTYNDLTNEKWRGRLLVRSSDHIHNQSLLASIIMRDGEAKAREWAAGIVANLARPPKGNDTDQIKAIAAGTGDIAIVNNYSIGRLLHSADPGERKFGAVVGVFFPKNSGEKTHVNITGIGITQYSPHIGPAVRFMEFMTDAYAQKVYAAGNFEYPVNPAVEAAELLRSWGDFEEDDLYLEKFGEYNGKARKIFEEVGWK